MQKKIVSLRENSNIDLDTRKILRMRLDATSYTDAVQRIVAWVNQGKRAYVCASNVHMVMEVWDDCVFASVVNGADLITPDGMPLVWALRLLGVDTASRVYGPTLMLRVCEAAASSHFPIALYGGTSKSLQDFSDFLYQRFPGIQITCKISPPFRPLTDQEDELYTQEIIDSKARLVLVGIGCPKQEYWMAAHKERIPAVMLGVGAAFDFYSGRVKQAPSWMQGLGLEWLFRLFMEPKRLWKRYAYNNPRFIIFFLAQLLNQNNKSL